MTEPEETTPTMDCICGHHEHLHENFEDACDWNSDRPHDPEGGFNCRCQTFEEMSS